MIYIIRMADTDYYKIGFTNHETPKQRLDQLQTACPRKLSIVAILVGDEKTESELHIRAWQYRTDGGSEWFQIPADVGQELTEGRQDQGKFSRCEGSSTFHARP